MKIMLVALYITLFGVGCGFFPQSVDPDHVPNRNPVNASGMFLKDAHQKSHDLLPGMAQAKVKEILAEPDDISANTVGSATSHPWNALIWDYRWHTYRTGPATSTFKVIFEKDAEKGWVVNSFFWYPQK